MRGWTTATAHGEQTSECPKEFAKTLGSDAGKDATGKRDGNNELNLKGRVRAPRARHCWLPAARGTHL